MTLSRLLIVPNLMSDSVTMFIVASIQRKAAKNAQSKRVLWLLSPNHSWPVLNSCRLKFALALYYYACHPVFKLVINGQLLGYPPFLYVLRTLSFGASHLHSLRSQVVIEDGMRTHHKHFSVAESFGFAEMALSLQTTLITLPSTTGTAYDHWVMMNPFMKETRI